MRHPLVRRNAFLNHVFGDVEKEMNRLFNSDEGSVPVETSDWAPAIDIKEEDKQFIISADIPGLALDQIDVSIDNDILTIRGQRDSEHKEKREGYLRIERVKGSFSRSIRLPDTANLNQVDAKYKQGVLHIFVPKQEQRVARKVAVKGEDN